MSVLVIIASTYLGCVLLAAVVGFFVESNECLISFPRFSFAGSICCAVFVAVAPFVALYQLYDGVKTLLTA